MRAITVKQPHASHIATGTKTTEERARRIAPGPLLVAAKGAAVCVVDVTAAEPGGDLGWIWKLARPRTVRPFPVRSYGWLVHVPDDAIVFSRRPLREAPPEVGPYTFQDGDRKIRGVSAVTPAEARKTARRLADERGDFVYIMRDGINVGGEWDRSRR